MALKRMVRVSEECHKRLQQIRAQKAAAGEGIVPYGRILEEALYQMQDHQEVVGPDTLDLVLVDLTE